MNGQIFGWDHWTGTALTLSKEVGRAPRLQPSKERRQDIDDDEDEDENVEGFGPYRPSVAASQGRAADRMADAASDALENFHPSDPCHSAVWRDV